MGQHPAVAVAAYAQNLGGCPQPMVGRVEEDVALKGARRFAVEAKLWQGCFKGFRVADAELNLDLNRLNGRSLYPFHDFSRSGQSPGATLLARAAVAPV